MCSMQKKNKERRCVPTLMNRTRSCSINKKRLTINVFFVLVSCIKENHFQEGRYTSAARPPKLHALMGKKAAPVMGPPFNP